MAKDFHCQLKDPYEGYLREITEALWKKHGRPGVPLHYDSIAARHCILETHKLMFPEQHKNDVVAA